MKFALTLLAAMSLSASAGTIELRIADWNIDKGGRLAGITRGLRELAPNVCVLQEVDQSARRTGNRNIARDLAASLGMNFVFGREFQELGQSAGSQPAYEGQATLSSFPILHSRVLEFQHQSGFWKPRTLLPNWPMMQRRTGGRIALIAELSAAGKLVVIYNLHLESRSLGRLQYRQLEEVLGDAKRYPPGTPVIVAGDLNTKYRPSLFVKRMERDGFRNCLGPSQRRTHEIVGTLDWIFAKGKIAARGGKVYQNIGGSDHYPLTAVLEIE